MCKWICNGPSNHDGHALVQQPVQLLVSISGLAELVADAKLPGAAAAALHQSLTEAGAVSVGELTMDDWQGCPA